MHHRDHSSAPTIVTGVAGFIGSHLASAMLARGDRLVGVDNFDPFYPRTLKERNLREVAATFDSTGRGAFEFIEADIADTSSMRSLFDRTKPKAVVHLAGKAGVRPSLADPAGYARANVLGTAVVLDAAKATGVSRVVVASSSSVYGNNAKTPFAEDDRVDEPISPYAATKKATELMAHAHWKLTGMPTACLRFFTVFGPRQRPDLAIASFMNRIARGETIRVFGDGSMRRDFTYVDDVVAGILAALDRIPTHGYRIWNLGSDRPVRLDAMVEAVARVVGRAPVMERLPMQPGDVDATWADLTRSRAELGYRTGTDFEEGLRRQWGWMRQNAGAL